MILNPKSISASVFSRAMDIAAMKLDADELDEHLFSIGVTKEELELIGIDCLPDDSARRNGDWDDFEDVDDEYDNNDFDTDNDFGGDDL